MTAIKWMGMDARLSAGLNSDSAARESSVRSLHAKRAKLLFLFAETQSLNRLPRQVDLSSSATTETRKAVKNARLKSDGSVVLFLVSLLPVSKWQPLLAETAYSILESSVMTEISTVETDVTIGVKWNSVGAAPHSSSAPETKFHLHLHHHLYAETGLSKPAKSAMTLDSL